MLPEAPTNADACDLELALEEIMTQNEAAAVAGPGPTQLWGGAGGWQKC